MKALTSAEAAERTRIVLGASILLWLGALMAWVFDADAAMLQYFETSLFFGRLRPVFEWFTDWGTSVYYVFFIALLVYGARYKHALFTRAAVAYLYAQVLGTFLLVRLLKIGCGRPRPDVAAVHDALCQAPSLDHAFNSFPSSHAANAAVGAVFVFLLLRSRIAAWVALTAALFMALARIAIGEHYVSDVLAGLALGVAIAAVAMRVYLLPRWKAIETA